MWLPLRLWGLPATAKELLALGFVLVLTAAFGATTLLCWVEKKHDSWPGGDFFSAPAMLAAGQGFINGMPAPESPFGAFIYEQVDGVSRADVTATQYLPLTPFQRAHRYLLYSIAFTWRVLGISYTALKIHQVGMLCISALLVYGICRLGANRVLSVLAALFFASTPPTLTVLQWERDFNKAPFLLGCFLLLGVLVKYRLSRRGYFAVAVGLGLASGIGLGFRQDLIITLPPSTLGLAAASLAVGGQRQWRLRATAIAVYLCTFLLAGAPMLPLTVSREMAGAQNALRGVTPLCEDWLLAKGSYFMMARSADHPLAMHASAYALSTLGSEHWLKEVTEYDFTSPKVEEAARGLLRETLMFLPADALVRAYAVPLWLAERLWSPWDAAYAHGAILDPVYAIERAVAHHFKTYQLFYAWLVLALLCAYSVRVGVLVFLFVMYFCAAASLQFIPRHAFHLGFLPLWMLAFVGTRACNAGLETLRTRNWRTVSNRLSIARLFQEPRLRQRCLYGIVLPPAFLVLLLVPLWLARAYQSYQWTPLLEQYQNATLQPAATLPQERLDADTCVVRPAQWDAAALLPAERWPADLAVAYWAVDIALTPDAQLGQTYAAGHGIFDLTARHALQFARSDSPMQVRYFFPTIELPPGGPDANSWNQFQGLTLTPPDCGSITGMYRVSNASEFRLLLNVGVPEDTARFERYKRLRPFEVAPSLRAMAYLLSILLVVAVAALPFGKAAKPSSG